jgi:hypothetical protein
LTANANITKGLVIGEAGLTTGEAFIRSVNATNVGGMSLNVVNNNTISGYDEGFIFRNDGQVIFGNSTNFVK